MKIYHFYHSGVCVETEKHQLFFDCISDVSDFIVSEKKQYFFITHSHSDHFSKEILKLEGRHIISDDCEIEDTFKARLLKPNETLEIDDLLVKTYDSTDRGLAFLVKLKNLSVLHAGDLNWWHWDNDESFVQKEEEKKFKEIVMGIESPIDIAFIPVDPRLKEASLWAATYFNEVLSIKTIVPIHFRDNFEITNRLNETLKNAKIIKEHNEVFEWQ